MPGLHRDRHGARKQEIRCTRRHRTIRNELTAGLVDCELEARCKPSQLLNLFRKNVVVPDRRHEDRLEIIANHSELVGGVPGFGFEREIVGAKCSCRLINLRCDLRLHGCLHGCHDRRNHIAECQLNL